jgi:hypothetical protein
MDTTTLSANDRSFYEWYKTSISDPQSREQLVLELLSSEYWSEMLEKPDDARTMRSSLCAHSN